MLLDTCFSLKGLKFCCSFVPYFLLILERPGVGRVDLQIVLYLTESVMVSLKYLIYDAKPKQLEIG